MANLGTLTTHIGADTTGLRTGLAQSQAQISRFSAGAMRSFAKLSGAFAALGVAVGGLALFRNITKIGIDFEQTMTTVAGVMRATAEESKALTAAARKMGETTEWSASQAGDALQFLGMAGFEANKAIAALPGTLDLATAGQIELGRAADIATNALTAMGLEVGELERVNDVFVGTITRSNTNMEMMAESFKYAAPVARAYGYTIEDLSSLIGMLGNAGIQGSMAGTQLAMAIQKTNEVAEEFGLKGGKFIDVLEQARAKGYSATEVMSAFGLRAGRAAGVLYEATDATREFQETLGGVQGEAKRLADTMRSTVGASFKELKSVIESLALDIFETYRDELKGFLVDTTAWIRDHKDDIVGFAGDIKTVLEDITERFIKLGEVLSTIRDPLSFYPKDLSEIDNWLAKIKDKLTWFFDKMPQFFILRKIIQPFREGGIREDWDWFLNKLVDINVQMGLMERKEIPPPSSFVGPMPTWPFIEPLRGIGGGGEGGGGGGRGGAPAFTIEPPAMTIPTEGLAEYMDSVKDMIAEYKRIQQNRYDWLYEHEQISAEEYVTFLEWKLGKFVEYSDEWMAIQGRIEEVQAAAAENAIELFREQHATAARIYDAIGGAAGKAFIDIFTKNQSLVKTLVDAWQWFMHQILNIFAEILAKWIAMKLIMSAATGPFGFLFGEGGMVKGMQAGGLVSGPRWPRDMIPIMATGGEFMIPEPAVRQIGIPALEHMRRTGSIPGQVTVNIEMGGFSFSGMKKADAYLAEAFITERVSDAVKDALKSRELEL